MSSNLLDYILNNEDAFKSKARLASLFSDFRHQRESNPAGFSANVAAWRSALENAARAGALSASAGSNDDDGGLLSLNVTEDLFDRLEMRGFGKPVGLGVALAEIVARHDWTPVSTRVPQNQDGAGGSMSGRSWIGASAAAVVWLSRQLGILGPANVRGDFALERNIEAAGNAFLRKLKEKPPLSYPDRVYSLSTFTKTYCDILSTPENAGLTLTPSDIQLLLNHLSTRLKVLSYSPNNQTISIRPAAAEQDFSSSKTAIAPPVSSTDVSVATLKTLDADLTSQIATLENRVADLASHARVLVASASAGASKAPAMSAIRSRRAAEKALSTRYATHAQVTDSLAAITDAADRVALVKALEGGAEVLHSLNAEVGGVEGAERVAARFREEMEAGEDINQAVWGDGLGATVDEDEVDRELEGLQQEMEKEKVSKQKEEEELREQTEIKETERRLAELGQTPSTSHQEPSLQGAKSQITPQQNDAVSVLESAQQLGRLSLEAHRPSPVEAKRQQQTEEGPYASAGKSSATVSDNQEDNRYERILAS